jgi:rubrerythrin
MIGGFYPDDLDINTSCDELREELDEIDKIETPDFTHECQVCGYLEEVPDHERHTPNWCESCEAVQTFVKLDATEKLNTE